MLKVYSRLHYCSGCDFSLVFPLGHLLFVINALRKNTLKNQNKKVYWILFARKKTPFDFERAFLESEEGALSKPKGSCFVTKLRK